MRVMIKIDAVIPLNSIRADTDKLFRELEQEFYKYLPTDTIAISHMEIEKVDSE